jgi:hypothetical protein
VRQALYPRDARGKLTHISAFVNYTCSFQKSLAACLESIRKNEPPPVPGIAGLEELQFEVALRRSVEQQRPVDVQAEFPFLTEEGR